MRRVLLIAWMVLSLIVGAYLVLASPVAIMNALKTAHGNVGYWVGTLFTIAIGFLLLGEFNRARKSLKRSKQSPPV